MMRKRRECLIIDDDLDDQEIFLMCLKKVDQDINCVAVHDGVEAISLLKSDAGYVPNYIFIDVNMPKLNGIECLKIIKNMERLQYAKIFMYSTTSEKSVLTQSRALGADDYIVKPSSPVELKEKLSKIFEIVSEITK